MIAGSLLFIVYVVVCFMPFALPKSITRAADDKLPFGLPSNWRGDQLPSKKDVGAFYSLKRAELDSEWQSVPST